MAVLLTTLLLTVAVDLVVAIEVGMVLAAFLFMRRMADIRGPFFFGAAEKFKETLHQMGTRPRVLILRMREVPAIDSTGLSALHDLVKRARHEGTRRALEEPSPLTPAGAGA